jgi:hypothetical protein
MDEQALVGAALQALGARDIERHLSHLADDVTVYEDNISPPRVSQGKAAYRELLDPLARLPDELWAWISLEFRITGVRDDGSQPGAVSIDIEIQVRHSGPYAGTPVQISDGTVRVRDGLIHEMRWRPRRTSTYRIPGPGDFG